MTRAEFQRAVDREMARRGCSWTEACAALGRRGGRKSSQKRGRKIEALKRHKKMMKQLHID